MKKVNDNPSSKLVKIFSVAEKDNQYLTKEVYRNAEEADKIFKDADKAKAKLNRAQREKWSDSAKKQANLENEMAQHKKSQFIADTQKNKSIVKAEKATQDSFARRYATATGMYDNGLSLGDNVSNNVLNKFGTNMSSYPVNWAKDKLGIGKDKAIDQAEDFNEEILEKENVILEEYKTTWNLCTGIKGFVEDEEAYANGAIFDGMEQKI